MRNKLPFFQLVLVLVMGVVLAGCRGDNQPPVSGGTKDSVNRIAVVEAKEGGIDRTQPDWLKQYCFNVVQESANLPVAYERRRGPLHVFEPVYHTQRFTRLKQAETCDIDYYLAPVLEEAYGDLDMEFSWGDAGWQSFEQAVLASVSAKLINDGWRAVESAEEQGRPKLMFGRTNTLENIREYIDVFMTPFEEMVFEVVVGEI